MTKFYKLAQLTYEEFAHEVMLVCFGLNQEFVIISNDLVTKSKKVVPNL